MNAGDVISIGGETAEVIKVRKTVPVAVVRFEDGHTDLHWYGDEPSAPAVEDQEEASTRVANIPVRSPAKATHSPETPMQAQWWTRSYGWYDRAGLCPRCSSQGAWGHQLGFSNVKPPCRPCGVIVAEFPTSAVNGWNQLTQHAAPQYALTASA